MKTTIRLDFDKMDGLVPAIAQDYGSGEVLMLAFMNAEAWRKTLDTGIVHYWSRSRGCLWKKGEQSGNIQQVKEIRVDCDSDCVLIKVKQIGEAACHTGYRSCFFNLVRGEEVITDGEIVFDPKTKYGEK
ncbi:MAG: phosphoribosyl-AMP cyclohydrolase [Spirochaetia bacterium]|jgi:phosphoribosyl-AMP cyclohydrolase|nr:phosphoribosyl-AMP cyclohydrolase [Spirochaetales bacterium]